MENFLIVSMDPIYSANENQKGAFKLPRKRLGDLFMEKMRLDDQRRHADPENIVDDIIKYALLQSATDIHIEVGEAGTQVRYRIGGRLHDAMGFSRAIGFAIIEVAKRFACISPEETATFQEGRIRLGGEGNGAQLQVSVLPYLYTRKMVMRILYPFSKGFTLEKLGMHGGMVELVHDRISTSRGIVLIAGENGSGTTTTAYTLVDILNAPFRSISTVEDPIEHRMLNVNQLQVDPKIGMRFDACLESLLKQDSDVLMIGEIRDSKMLRGTITAAGQGRLAIATIHAENSLAALEMILDMDTEAFEVTSTLGCIIGQRLAPRLCPQCRIPHSIDGELEKTLSRSIDLERIRAFSPGYAGAKKNIPEQGRWKGMTAYRAGRGCARCGSRGFIGNAGIFEVFVMTRDIARLIFKQASLGDIAEKARENGMCTLREDATLKALAGAISSDELLAILGSKKVRTSSSC